MSTLTLIFTAVFLPLILVRLLRWVAWAQQKEYRPDRLWHFITSEEGLSELMHVIPKKSDFTRTGLKRPVITLRATLTGFISLVFIGYALTAGYTFGWWWLAPLVYFGVPVFPGLVGLISELGKTVLSLILLFAAKQKMAAKKPKILGITGSYGKTTTRHLVAHLLSQEFTTFTPQKSHNTPLSTAWSILKGYAGESIAFLEFAAYKKGEIARLAYWFPPELSLVTGVAPQHLALFGSVENIIQAKGELVRATRLDGLVLYNGNDPDAIAVCQQDPSKKAVPYSGPESTVPLSQVRLNGKGRLQFVWRGHEIRTHLIGLHNTNAVQAAIVVALELGVPEKKIRAGLASFLPTDNYITIYSHRAQQFTIINDGKTSNPKGFLSALDILDHFKKTGKNTVLITSGILDLGEQSDEEHLKLAKAAKDISDVVLYTGVDGQHVFREVFGSRMTTHETAMRAVLEKLNENDVVLIEGSIPKWLMQQLKREL